MKWKEAMKRLCRHGACREKSVKFALLALHRQHMERTAFHDGTLNKSLKNIQSPRAWQRKPGRWSRWPASRCRLLSVTSHSDPSCLELGCVPLISDWMDH